MFHNKISVLQGNHYAKIHQRLVRNWARKLDEAMVC